jgi:hypothetical protein
LLSHQWLAVSMANKRKSKPASEYSTIALETLGIINNASETLAISEVVITSALISWQSVK